MHRRRASPTQYEDEREQAKLGYEEEALSKYMCAGQVLATLADVN